MLRATAALNTPRAVEMRAQPVPPGQRRSSSEIQLIGITRPPSVFSSASESRFGQMRIVPP